RIQRAIPFRSRAGENKHVALTVRPVWSWNEKGIVTQTHGSAGLNKAGNVIIPKSTAPKIILLIISSGLGESLLIKAVVIPVGPPKQLDDGSVNVIRGIQCQIEREIEHPVWISNRTWPVGLLVEIAIHESIRIISRGGVIRVVNPPCRRGICV